MVLEKIEHENDIKRINKKRTSDSGRGNPLFFD